MNGKIEALIAQMTLEEKISMLAGADTWHTVPIKRLGIPAIRVTDGPIGARGTSIQSGVTSACFPCGTALAATWDQAIVERVGKALGEETKAKGACILLAPTVNIHRSAWWAQFRMLFRRPVPYESHGSCVHRRFAKPRRRRVHQTFRLQRSGIRAHVHEF